MLLIGDADTTKNIDNYAVTNLNIPSIVLMENAAINFVKTLNKNLDNFLIICGKGNNGGDGYAIARQLLSLNKNVSIFSCETNNMSIDCEINYTICKNLGIHIETNFENLMSLLQSCSVIIDSIFGTGLDKKLNEPYEKIISLINKANKYTVSVDIPSGINSTTGEIMGICVKANQTISFVTYKQGFLNYDILDFLGKVTIVNIGIPKAIKNKFSKKFLLDKKYIRKLYKPRSKSAHKGNFGHSLILAGSIGFTGASIISANSAVKTGSGLVTLITHKEVQSIVSEQTLEAMTANFDDKDHFLDLLNKADSIAFGPGLGNSTSTLELLELVINNTKTPVILDADGINASSNKPSLLKSLENRAIFTPHPGEFTRLSGYSINQINHNRIKLAIEFAKKNSVILVLKGHNTIITDGSELFVNTTGNSHMSNGGMGDSLTGIITSLVSQGYSLLDSANIGCFLHGYIGDKLEKNLEVITAGDIINNIPKYQKKIFR